MSYGLNASSNGDNKDEGNSEDRMMVLGPDGKLWPHTWFYEQYYPILPPYYQNQYPLVRVRLPGVEVEPSKSDSKEEKKLVEEQEMKDDHQEVPQLESSENLYPSGQSLVLNPEDPNGEPIYSCGKCQRQVNVEEQAILCQAGCTFWYHLACTDLSQFAFEQLCNISNSLFACDSCMETNQDLHCKFEKLQSELQKLQDKHQKLGFEHEDLQSDHKDIENSLDEVEHEYQNHIAEENGLKTDYQILQCRFDKSQDEKKILGTIFGQIVYCASFLGGGGGESDQRAHRKKALPHFFFATLHKL